MSIEDVLGDMRASTVRHPRRGLRAASEVRAVIGPGLATGSLIRVCGEAVLAGAVLLAGGAATTVKIYDAAEQAITPKDGMQMIGLLKAAAGALDRTAPIARRAYNGIALTTDQNDAIILVLYR